MSTRARTRLRPSQFASGTLRIAARELGAAFDSWIAPVYAVAFALLANSIFMNEFFLRGALDMTPFFGSLPLLFAVFLPAISMRLWAEERKARTVELLLTLPLLPIQAILGKHLAGMGLLLLFLATSLPIPIMLGTLGEPDYGRIFGGYLGSLFLGSAFLAIGGLASALTKDQIVAFVLTAVSLFALVLSGDASVVAILDGLRPTLALGTWLRDSLSVTPPFDAFTRGLLELSGVVHFTLLTLLALWGTTLVLQRNRA
ncbi:MAG: ABC-2 type transport system permease protein [Planctomycetota bacterium]